MGAVSRSSEVKLLLSVLLVDSEAEYRMAAARALEGRAFRVAQAGGGDEALTLLRRGAPDAVVLDLGKDVEADLAILARIRSANPRLPVIVLADVCETALAMRSLELGAVDVLNKPADIDHIGNRLRSLVATGQSAPREKSIADLMVPASAYHRVYEDEPVQRVIEVLTQSLFHTAPGKVTERGRRSVLVYSRAGNFLGCIRLNDILDLLIPPSWKEAFVPFEPGMFLARCKLIGNVTAGEMLGEQRFVDVEAPLMEAVQLMVVDSLINIPVLKEGNLVGILTDRNLLLEICHLATRGD
jgi:DNA-binding response OmpR family regulator